MNAVRSFRVALAARARGRGGHRGMVAARAIAGCGGWTLPELMVGSAVGFAIAVLAAALLLGAHASFLAQDDAASIEDSGRFALAALGRAIRQAAYVDWEQPVERLGGGVAQVGGLDARSLAGTVPALDAPQGSAVNGSDVLALRFAGASDGSVVNCAGFEVADADHGWSIFYVAVGPDGRGELRCKYRGASAWRSDALVRGVDTMQVLYGVDTNMPEDGMPDTYLTASAIVAHDAGIVPQGATPIARTRDFNRKTYWKRVCSIRVSLLLHGERTLRDAGSPPVFHLFGRAYSDTAGASDPGTVFDTAQLPELLRHRERRLFGATFLLRNRPA